MSSFTLPWNDSLSDDAFDIESTEFVEEDICSCFYLLAGVMSYLALCYYFVRSSDVIKVKSS